jgi:hypothetical protein
MDHGTQVTKELVCAYGRRCNSSLLYPASRDVTIDLGLRLGKILSIKYVLPTTNTLVLLYTSTRRVSTPRGHHQWLL